MKRRVKFIYLKDLENVDSASQTINTWLDTLSQRTDVLTKFQVNFKRQGNKDLLDIVYLTEYALADNEIEK